MIQLRSSKRSSKHRGKLRGAKHARHNYGLRGGNHSGPLGKVKF